MELFRQATSQLGLVFFTRRYFCQNVHVLSKLKRPYIRIEFVVVGNVSKKSNESPLICSVALESSYGGGRQFAIETLLHWIKLAQVVIDRR